MKNIPRKIVIHHTADETDENQFDKVDRYHKSKDFPVSSLGYFVGYHFFIEKSGEVIQARLVTDEGAHCQGSNFRTLGVCLAGNFENEEPTNTQLGSLGRLLNKLVQENGLSVIDIIEHGQLRPTACPGHALNIDVIRQAYINQITNPIKKAIVKLLCSLSKTY